VKLGTENRKKTIWAAVLAAIAVIAVAYEILPYLWGPAPTPGSSAQAAAPTPTRPTTARPGAKAAKKLRPTENLDPTLQLQLLASSEQMKYEGSGRNIFVSEAEEVKIEAPKGTGATDHPQPVQWKPPDQPQAPAIPLKFFGFASGPGEPKKVFLSKESDVFIAGEGEIVDRRYKVVRISPTSVEIEDLLFSGQPQTIQLTTS